MYTMLHGSIYHTAGIATREHRDLTDALMIQMNKPLNLSWFAGTTGMFPHRLPFYNPRPDPTPECDSADRALRWFQENIGDAPLNPNESDLRLLKMMSAWHSAALGPGDSNDAKKALLEEDILTDEESDQDETDGSGTTPYESSMGAVGGTAHENLPTPSRHLTLLLLPYVYQTICGHRGNLALVDKEAWSHWRGESNPNQVPSIGPLRY